MPPMQAVLAFSKLSFCLQLASSSSVLPLSYNISAPSNSSSLSLHSGNSPSMTHSTKVFKGLYQWLLSLFPFLWKLKFLETLCLQTAAKKTGFIQGAILPSLWPLGATGFSKSPTCRQMGQFFHPSPLVESIYRKGIYFIYILFIYKYTKSLENHKFSNIIFRLHRQMPQCYTNTTDQLKIFT